MTPTERALHNTDQLLLERIEQLERKVEAMAAKAAAAGVRHADMAERVDALEGRSPFRARNEPDDDSGLA